MEQTKAWLHANYPDIRKQLSDGSLDIADIAEIVSNYSTTPTVRPEGVELTVGEKAAGVTFNPSNMPSVDRIKQKFAAIIDELNDSRNTASSQGAKRYYSKAISYSEDAQMNAVKAATWRYE
jgi:hypothetical protein